jgi:hypothetical protein
VKLRAFPGSRNPSAAQRVQFSKKEQDVKRLREVVALHSPALIVLDASSFDVFEFQRELQRDILYDFPKLPIHLAAPDAARVFSNSERGKKMFPECSRSHRLAISLGRSVLSPLEELAAAWCESPTTGVNEILSLRLHPSMAVVGAALLPALRRVLVDVVNKAGVDLNRVLRHPHLNGTVQFVCGLGPRKARQLLEYGRDVGGVATRKQLHKNWPPEIAFDDGEEAQGGEGKGHIFDSVVGRNCLGFLRVASAARSRLSDKKKLTHTQLLDGTRLQPELYALARHIAKFSLEVDFSELHPGEDLPEFKDSDQLKRLQLFFNRRRHRALVAQLLGVGGIDIDAYKEAEGRHIPGSINLMLHEQCAPFEAPQCMRPYEPLAPRNAYEIIAGETESEMTVRVTEAIVERM